MKKLIVTRADENIKEMTDITHPILRKYAKMCNADFEIISESGNIHPHYRIMYIRRYFDFYDRILVIDSDILLLNTIPNVFDIVPNDKIGCIFEDKLSRKDDRRKRINKVQEERGDIGWRKGYINTGFILFSKKHADLFDYDKEKLYLDLGYDDVYLGYMLNSKDYEVYELSCEWNFMSMFMDEKSRADAYVLHYAGQAFHPMINRVEQINNDYLLFEKYGALL